jgi:hypothetical protein
MLVALPVLLAGCVSAVAGALGESLGVPVEEKVVSSKVEPNIIVATDGTTCTASRQRWDKAEVGKPFLCPWSKD